MHRVGYQRQYYRIIYHTEYKNGSFRNQNLQVALKGKASFIDCFCFFRATLFMANIQSCLKNASKIKKEQMQSTPPFFDIPILKKLLNYMLHHKVLYCDGLCCLSIHFPYDLNLQHLLFSYQQEQT